MTYDYYEYLKKARNSDEYIEIEDIVRKNIWSDSIDFKISEQWRTIEEKIRINLYLFLRYN